MDWLVTGALDYDIVSGSTRLQSDHEIDQILSAAPSFLSRIARIKRKEGLLPLVDQYRISNEIHCLVLPLLIGRPSSSLPENGLNHAGLLNLLDLSFDDGRSGIVCSPHQNQRHELAGASCEQWCKFTCTNLLEGVSGIDDATLAKSIAHLHHHTMDRYDNEIHLEISSARHFANIAIVQILEKSQDGPETTVDPNPESDKVIVCTLSD